MQILNYSTTPKMLGRAGITWSESCRARGEAARDCNEMEITPISLNFSISKPKQKTKKASTSKTRKYFSTGIEPSTFSLLLDMT